MKKKMEKKVLMRFVADNGDIFVRIYCPIDDGDACPECAQPLEIIPCVAKFRTEPIPHLSYYRKDNGQFIATAGVHVHDKQADFTKYLYEKRTSGRTQVDNIADTLYFN